MGGLLGQLGGGGLLDSVLGSQPTPVEQGNDVLGQIFGSKDVSRTVAGSGRSADRDRSGDSQADAADPRDDGRGLYGEAGRAGRRERRPWRHARQCARRRDGRRCRTVGGLAGGLGGLGKMLDMDGDGNPLDDIMGMVNKMRG